LDKPNETKEEIQKLQKELESLTKKKNIIQSAIQVMSKKYQTQIHDRKKDFDSIYYEKA